VKARPRWGAPGGRRTAENESEAAAAAMAKKHNYQKYLRRYFAIYIYSMYAGIYDISDREKKIFKLVIYLTEELGCFLFEFLTEIFLNPEWEFFLGLFRENPPTH